VVTGQWCLPRLMEEPLNMKIAWNPVQESARTAQ